jgi:hypothetical protein
VIPRGRKIFFRSRSNARNCNIGVFASFGSLNGSASVTKSDSAVSFSVLPGFSSARFILKAIVHVQKTNAGFPYVASSVARMS